MQRRTYLDFDLEIAPDSGGYLLHVVQSPAGQVRVHIPAAALAAELFHYQPEAETLSSTVPSAQASMQQIGQTLFRAVFCDDILARLAASQVNAQQHQCGLRIRLRLNQAPELMALPWEALFYSAGDRYLALSGETPLVHFLELPQKAAPLASALPLNILVVLSTPHDLPALDKNQEWTVLQQAMQPLLASGSATLTRLDMPTLSALQRELRNRAYHILHFIGHGSFSAASGEGALLFCNPQGNAAAVSARDLATIVADATSLRLAVLNGCSTARNGPHNPFGGIANALVSQGVPAVLAMHSTISDQAALLFSYEFYSALAQGQPVESALTEGRKALFTQVNSSDWIAPRLIMHAGDGHLWALAAAGSSKNQQTLQAVGEGIALLVELYNRPRFRATLASFQTDFEAAGAQIALLNNYKDFHDHLHTVEFLCYNSLTRELTRFPGDALSRDVLSAHQSSLHHLLQELQAVQARPGMPAEEQNWIGQLEQADYLLAQAAESTDTEQLRHALRLMKRVLDLYPSRINQRLNAAARALRLESIESGMKALHADVALTQLASTYRGRLDTGISALGSLRLQIARLVDDHDRWQEIDLELRRVESTLNMSISELTLVWKDLSQSVMQMCGDPQQDWAVAILRTSGLLEQALASTNPHKVRQEFSRYRRDIAQRFYRVDTDLKDLCHELRTVAQPLADAFLLLA
ncbi:MAG: CHAT domain-containing protein [Caldilineales bacterium]